MRVTGDHRECVRGRGGRGGDGEKKEQRNVYLEPRTNATCIGVVQTKKESSFQLLTLAKNIMYSHHLQ